MAKKVGAVGVIIVRGRTIGVVRELRRNSESRVIQSREDRKGKRSGPLERSEGQWKIMWSHNHKMSPRDAGCSGGKEELSASLKEWRGSKPFRRRSIGHN